MNQESFGSKFRTWKNQYIDLVESKTDRIISLIGEKPTLEQQAQFNAWVKPYPEIFCEIGSGSGGHLIEQAALKPAAAFVGFELRFKRAFKTVAKAEARGLNNLFLVRANANCMREFYDPLQLSGIYINFPDPWSKQHWKKNRILNPSFLETLNVLLKPQGFLSYKTDHSEYFEETLASVRNMPSYSIRKISTDLYASEFLSTNVPSEFEKLFCSQKLKINFLEAVKLGN